MASAAPTPAPRGRPAAAPTRAWAGGVSVADDVERMLRFHLQTLTPVFAPDRCFDTDPGVAPDAVSRVLVIGDSGGKPAVVDAAIATADRHGCQAVVSCGDFWLEDGGCDDWEPGAGCAAATSAAADSPIPVVVVDGNHEAWPCLNRVARTSAAGAAAAAGRPLHLLGSLWWARRGSTWTWHGRRIGALGGAVSPDAWMPHLAHARWRRSEAPTRRDLDRLLANAADGLDMLITHDAPSEAWWLVSGLKYKMPAALERAAQRVRPLISEAIETLDPAVAVHGHWDCAGRGRLSNGTEVVSLADAPGTGSAAVVDLSDVSVRVVPFTNT